ncbi:MAG: ribosomal large subunit pseudouridine synthase D [uncultured bacterium]|nr:MAG: ribosomal large subunit pseudouridine synthase D [uncultured bacterium]
MTSVKHLIKENETGRIDLVVQKLTERSRTQVRGLFDHGCVLLNGVVCDNAGERVRASDEVSVHYDKNRNYKELPKKYRSPIFDLIFEDEWILVVDKKAGYLTVPTDHREPNTVVGALCQYMSLGKPKRRLVSIVHRLDRDTSGLLVFAKNEKIAQQIKAQFENRKPLREYLAIVRGRLDSPTGTFKSFLATDKGLNQYSTQDKGDGKLAITHYKIKQVYKDTTLVAVTLETGRRNQIRVHFAEQGHPVLGDVRYEADRASHPRWKAKRLALHAGLLGFKHPVTGKDVVFRSKTPEEFEIFAGQK